MATTATTARLLCSVSGGDSGDKVVNVSWTLSAPLLTVDRETLTQGANNTITVPSGATLCVIVPPTDNTQALTLKGVAGDTGYVIDANTPTVLALSGSSFVINVGAGSNIAVEFSWL